jgi:aminoglycoside phosphotransferase (APT) family kinase protein/putative sterol carrier protein
MISRRVDLSDMQSKLIAWLQKKMPRARNLSISGMERSGAGLSNETFLFDLGWREARGKRSEGMVLRYAPQSYPVFPEYDLGKQFRIMERLKGTNIPVPKVYWLEKDEKILGAPFYLMGKIDGVIPPEYPPYHSFGVYFDATPQQRAKMWWGTLEAIVKVHKLDWESRGFSFLGVPKSGTDPLDRQLDYYEKYLDWVKDDPQESQPILEAALNWLKKNRYIPERVTLCWGDCRMPNTIYSRDNFDVLGILDWEMAYLGDPQSDLGWFLFLDWQHSEGYGIPRLEGSPGREETVQRYQELTGWKVKDLFYNDVLAALESGVIMLKVFKNFKKLGVALPGEDVELNNPCTQRLASLLDLPAPGAPKREMTRIEEVTVTVQFHLTGPGGSDWYLVSDRGKGTRHKGTVENPNATLTVSAEDWAAMQRGEIDRLHAWTSGKLKIEGDMTLLLQLEDLISKFSQP